MPSGFFPLSISLSLSLSLSLFVPSPLLCSPLLCSSLESNRPGHSQTITTSLAYQSDATTYNLPTTSNSQTLIVNFIQPNQTRYDTQYLVDWLYHSQGYDVMLCCMLTLCLRYAMLCYIYITCYALVLVLSAVECCVCFINSRAPTEKFPVV